MHCEMGACLYLDLYGDDTGRWSVEAYDLPDKEHPSATLPFTSADLQSRQSHRLGVKRLILTEALLTPFFDMVKAEDAETLYLYMYQPKARDQTLAFEREIEPRYQDYYASVGCFYAGLFDVEGLPGAYLGEILSFRTSPVKAKGFLESFEPTPEIEQIESECRTLQERELPRFLLWLSR